MNDVQPEATSTAESPAAETHAPETPKHDAPKQETSAHEAPKRESQKPQGQSPRPREDRPREDRPPRGDSRDKRPGERRPDDRRPGGGPDRGERGDRRDARPGGGRPFEMAPEIELEKLIGDSLYLDNQAHAVVARMRDMDSGTKSQLRRLYNAVRRAVRAPENERQHQFVMLRARLAYTIARHSLRSLDALERLLLQVTRRNDARGYERFKDLFEAIVAYNE
ncbi:MAG TPA: type III-A CRISPR-associated protein Csm2 [Bryobacteraceae bacterium]|nr:type III-A CRISPR-associated protein Csm2 [Bryobacteraceae bacterium]